MNLTPREKAIKLVDTFRIFSDGGNPENDRFSPKINKDNAIQCALIHSEEIISLMIKFHGRHIENNLIEIKYWHEVKKELKLL